MHMEVHNETGNVFTQREGTHTEYRLDASRHTAKLARGSQHVNQVYTKLDATLYPWQDTKSYG